jgi:hypothetical protein
VGTPHAPSVNATRSSVADATTSTLLLAPSRGRKGATIFNDSSAILRVGLGDAEVTATDFTIEMAADGYYELPFGFTGKVLGIWASDAGGSARITDLL